MDAIGFLHWGTHFCHFYKTRDLLDILVPFFRAGIENGELCIWTVFDPLTEESALKALRDAVPDADRRIEASDIQIIPHSTGAADCGRRTRRSADRAACAFQRPRHRAAVRRVGRRRLCGRGVWNHRQSRRSRPIGGGLGITAHSRRGEAADPSGWSDGPELSSGRGRTAAFLRAADSW